MTKPVTSVALMMLVEEGRIALDDPVRPLHPGVARPGVYVGGCPAPSRDPADRAPMRVVDLLRHTSGLTYGFQNAHQRRRRLPRAEARRLRAAETWTASSRSWPGCRWSSRRARAWNYSRLDRRRRLSGRQDLGPAVRRVPAAAHPRAAGHGRHRLPRAPRPRRSASPRATARRPTARCAAGARPTASSQPPRFASGGGGLVVDRRRLPALLRDAAERRRARRRAPPRPEDARADAHEPPARRPRPGRPRRARCSRKPPTRASASASASRW